MKYIRVKDDCYEWITTFAEYDEARNKATELGLTYSLKIIKQSDTIAELCDVFVKENEYCGQVSQSMYSDFEKAKQNIDITSNDVIYGALIIAGKGIIYVAQMNDEGELELL